MMGGTATCRAHLQPNDACGMSTFVAIVMGGPAIGSYPVHDVGGRSRGRGMVDTRSGRRVWGLRDSNGNTASGGKEWRDRRLFFFFFFFGFQNREPIRLGWGVSGVITRHEAPALTEKKTGR